MPIALTMGEPSGVGTEIALSSWLALRGTSHTFLLLHDPDWVAHCDRTVGLDVPVRTIAHPAEASGIFVDALPVLPIGLAAPIVFGKPDIRTLLQLSRQYGGRSNSR